MNRAAGDDGVPLELRTHRHRQGYLDLDPIIPELVNHIAYARGPCRADVGDFSSAFTPNSVAKSFVETPLIRAFARFIW